MLSGSYDSNNKQNRAYKKLKEGALISKVWLTYTHQIDYSKKQKKNLTNGL